MGQAKFEQVQSNATPRRCPARTAMISKCAAHVPIAGLTASLVMRPSSHPTSHPAVWSNAFPGQGEGAQKVRQRHYYLPGPARPLAVEPFQNSPSVRGVPTHDRRHLHAPILQLVRGSKPGPCYLIRLLYYIPTRAGWLVACAGQLAASCPDVCQLGQEEFGWTIYPGRSTIGDGPGIATYSNG